MTPEQSVKVWFVKGGRGRKVHQADRRGCARVLRQEIIYHVTPTTRHHPVAAADRTPEGNWQKTQFQGGGWMVGPVDKLDRFSPNCVNSGSNPGCRIVVCHFCTHL